MTTNVQQLIVTKNADGTASAVFVLDGGATFNVALAVVSPQEAADGEPI